MRNEECRQPYRNPRHFERNNTPPPNVIPTEGAKRRSGGIYSARFARSGLPSPRHQSSHVEDDRDADQGARQTRDETLPEVGRRVDESLRNDAGRETEHPCREQRTGVVKTVFENHVFLSIGEMEPGHGRQLDHRHGGGDGEKVPAPDVVRVVPIGPEAHRHEASADTGDAGGLQAVGENAWDRLSCRHLNWTGERCSNG